VAGQWQAPPGWRKTREQVFRTYGRACWRCGNYATTVDHVVPVILGGGHDLPNLRPACARCNYSAGAAVGNRLRGLRPSRSPGWVTSRRW
jgi:5-methylcytosine-specific restriction endonuclease McrA